MIKCNPLKLLPIILVKPTSLRACRRFIKVIGNVRKAYSPKVGKHKESKEICYCICEFPVTKDNKCTCCNGIKHYEQIG